MGKAGKVILIIVATICIIAIAFSIICSVTPLGKAFLNSWKAAVQKADDATNYETLKKVEDTCRAMIATYDRDKAEYERCCNDYIFNMSKATVNNDETLKRHYLKAAEEARELAESYRQQANNTASTYNDYILKNSYVWKNDVPADIYMKLEYIGGSANKLLLDED